MNPTHHRLEALRRSLAPSGVDALLVTGENHLRYLTGFTGEQTALILGRDRAWMVSDAKFVVPLAEECPELEAVIRPVGQAVFTGVADTVAKLGLRRVGFDPAAIAVAQFETIQNRSGSAEWIPVSGHVERLRAIKEPGEIAVIREAIGQAEAAFAQVVAQAAPDHTEKDMADAIEAGIRREGATAAAFAPIVATGRHAALPHARPQADARLGHADFTLVDWGASHGGYKSDLTRMVVTGKVSTEFMSVYQTVLRAQQAAIATLRPGVTAGEVDLAARSIIEEAGYGPAFSHGLGHGIGLDIHEIPFFRRDASMVLGAGMVVTIEPGIYQPEWGGVRIEDDVLITEDGAEVLTHLPRTLDECLRPW